MNLTILPFTYITSRRTQLQLYLLLKPEQKITLIDHIYVSLRLSLSLHLAFQSLQRFIFLACKYNPMATFTREKAFGWSSQTTWAGGNRVNDKVWEAWTAVTYSNRRTPIHGLSYKRILSLHYKRLKYIQSVDFRDISGL